MLLDMIYGKGLQVSQTGGSSILFCCFASPVLHCVYKNIVIFAGSIEVKTVDHNSEFLQEGILSGPVI